MRRGERPRLVAVLRGPGRRALAPGVLGPGGEHGSLDARCPLGSGGYLGRPWQRLVGLPDGFAQADLVQLVDDGGHLTLHGEDVVADGVQVVRRPPQALGSQDVYIALRLQETSVERAAPLRGLQRVAAHARPRQAHDAQAELVRPDLAVPVVQDVEDVGQLLEVDVQLLHLVDEREVVQDVVELLPGEVAAAVLVHLVEDLAKVHLPLVLVDPLVVGHGLEVVLVCLERPDHDDGRHQVHEHEAVYSGVEEEDDVGLGHRVRDPAGHDVPAVERHELEEREHRGRHVAEVLLHQGVVLEHLALGHGLHHEYAEGVLHKADDHEGPEAEVRAIHHAVDQRPELKELGHDADRPDEARDAEDSQSREALEEVHVHEGEERYDDPGHEHAEDPDEQGVEDAHRLEEPGPGEGHEAHAPLREEGHDEQVFCRAEPAGAGVVLRVRGVDAHGDGV
mmetsp:Transcript_6217/g.18365  ORF Transcript_6217/g.18365 Transcript_6217/m.18365 type:complete len:451 (-) Transcript_6217:703-2055(-)